MWMAGTIEKKAKGRKTKKKPGKRRSLANLERTTAAILAVNGDLDEVFPEWSKYLRSRKQPEPLTTRLKSKVPPLLWSVDDEDVGAASLAQIRRLQSARGWKETDLNATATSWCDDVTRREPTAAFGLDCLAWTSALPQLSQTLSAESWARVFSILLEVSNSVDGSLAEKKPWESQLILGELPIALGYCFPEVDICVDRLKQGCEFVSSSVTELLDGSGLTEAQHLALLRKLLACWMRCAWMTELNSKKRQRLSKPATREIDWLVRNVLRLARADHSYAFQPLREKPATDLSDMMSAAVRWTQDSEDRALLKLVVDGEDVSDSRLPENPAYHSEWSEVAVLQPEWNPKEPRLTITFDNSEVRAEMSNRGEVIFSGPWEPTVHVDGKRLEVVSEWDVNCWFSDFDVDFLEIEAELTSGWRIQRQFIMARQDHFCWTADILLSDLPGTIDYQLITTLADGVIFDGAEESREGMIRGRRTLAAVCPPSLPEWRAESHLGDLRQEPANGMTIRHRHYGQALVVPLFFDLHRRRMRQPITWRQLTVAEHLDIVTADAAVGYRVQAGPEQWLCYRSMTEEGNRTVLGQNYSSEFVLGRFLKDGDVESLVEIEGSEEDEKGA
jgi:hypothetical protein